jgi:hypothetical protein
MMPDWVWWTLIIIHFVLAIWAVIHLASNPRFPGLLRVMFVIVILVFVIFGPLMYLVMKDAQPKRFGGG